MASPFQAATTLSSLAGRIRWARASSSRALTWASQSWPGGSARSWSTDCPCSNVPALVTPKTSAARRPSSSPRTSMSWSGVQT